MKNIIITTEKIKLLIIIKVRKYTAMKELEFYSNLYYDLMFLYKHKFIDRTLTNPETKKQGFRYYYYITKKGRDFLRELGL